MPRSRIGTVVFGTCVLAAVALVCILFAGSLITEQRVELDLKTIRNAVERQEIPHRRVEEARRRLPKDSGLAEDWSLEQAMTAWNNDNIDTIYKLARKLFRRDEDLSEVEMERLTRFVMHSPEVSELLSAIEHGLCELVIDPAKGQRQISIHALLAMTRLLSARASLLAENGDTNEAMRTVLNIYELVDNLTEVPNLTIQNCRPQMLMYTEYALRDGINPEEISDESRAALLAYLEKQSSPEPIANALLLHEALVRREVAEKFPSFMVSWNLVGYHRGIQRMIQYLDKPEGEIVAAIRDKEILDEVPFYALQTGWRLRNVVDDALYVRVNTQRHVARMRSFLGIQ